MGTALGITLFTGRGLVNNAAFFTKLPLSNRPLLGLLFMPEVAEVGILWFFSHLSFLFITPGIGLHPLFILPYQGCMSFALACTSYFFTAFLLPRSGLHTTAFTWCTRRGGCLSIRRCPMIQIGLSSRSTAYKNKSETEKKAKRIIIKLHHILFNSHTCFIH